MRKKTLGIALILGLSASLYGCGTTESADNSEINGPAAVADEEESESDGPSEMGPSDEIDEEQSVGPNGETGDEEITDFSEGPSASNTDSMENGSEGMSGDDADAKRQIELIVSKSDKWVDTTGEEYYYSVMDLDHDGKLEIVTATNQGSGLYTYLKMFEVNDTNDDLVEITVGNPDQEGGGMNTPDIIINGNFVTYNSGSEYIYIASDYIKVGGDESWEAVEAFKLDGNSLSVEELAIKDMKGDDVTYKDGNAEKDITEEEFLNSADAKYGSEYTKYETTFHWDLLEGDDMSNKLLECYKTFAGR